MQELSENFFKEQLCSDFFFDKKIYYFLISSSNQIVHELLFLFFFFWMASCMRYSWSKPLDARPSLISYPFFLLAASFGPCLLMQSLWLCQSVSDPSICISLCLVTLFKSAFFFFVWFCFLKTQKTLKVSLVITFSKGL